MSAILCAPFEVFEYENSVENSESGTVSSFAWTIWNIENITACESARNR